MSLTQSLKRAVPLSLKEGYHRQKGLPGDLLFRAANRCKGAPPLPPGELIELVAGHKNPRWFLRGGASAAGVIREMTGRAGRPVARTDAVLDFGCGVGRIMRHWKGTDGPRFHGTDYNPRLIEWCRGNLRFARFGVNTLDGPLAYDSDSFGLVYAFSVFTHLTEPLQKHWMGELGRVLRPGGFLYLTVHGEHYMDKLTDEERGRFAAGELVVKEAAQVGSNFCAAYHPRRYVEATLAEGFVLLECRPRGARGDSDHDAYLLRKL